MRHFISCESLLFFTRRNHRIYVCMCMRFGMFFIMRLSTNVGEVIAMQCLRVLTTAYSLYTFSSVGVHEALYVPRVSGTTRLLSLSLSSFLSVYSYLYLYFSLFFYTYVCLRSRLTRVSTTCFFFNFLSSIRTLTYPTHALAYVHGQFCLKITHIENFS